MDLCFKISMFITSFLPLWGSIVFINIWSICDYSFKNWCNKATLNENILILTTHNWLELSVIAISLILPIVSIFSINKFLKDKQQSVNKPTATIISATKANKLSSEFLLAYILPLIAFDFSELRDLILFFTYFLILAILCIRNNNIYANIFLEWKKYKLYECDIERCVMADTITYKNTLVISRVDVTEPREKIITFYDFENYIYLNLKGDNE